MIEWVIDLRMLAPGYYLGGNAGRVQPCALCGLGAVRLSNTRRKTGLHARFAHRLTLRLNAKHEPIALYDLRHIARGPINDNSAPESPSCDSTT